MSSSSNGAGVISDLGLRSVTDIPEKYQHIFSGYPCFNAIQSKLLDFILETDESLVVSAPTGSGKTVLFELAIIRLLMQAEDNVHHGPEAKIVYMAPVKALVSEKYNDWVEKFSSVGVRCLEVTGDSDFMSLVTIRDYQLILTTPEKWDSMTRLWNKTDHLGIIQQVRLFLIDEVHLLNEERRGSTLEAVVSRMKTVQKTIDRSGCGLRFVAVSATIPNGEDLAVWLGSNNRPARFAKIGDDMRPVKLKKVVLGFRHDEFKTAFQFDMSLSYHLKNVVLKYSNGKPTLVFCNSRKSVQTTSSILAKQVKFQTEGAGQQILLDAANQISDVTHADLLKAGIGNHHAGMSLEDRLLIEKLFKDGKLPVLVTTSTLAMGVNLPAHLVVIKSTDCYMQNEMKPYTDSQVLQMIGRAGRPQFDTSAVAVIMTKTTDKERFERLVSGTEPIESTLHKNLAELLNAEVVLRTVTDVAVAVDWISSTYFYVRASRCPQRYGLPSHLPLDAFHARLHDLCMIELNGLARYKIIEMSGGYDVSPTDEGSLMAKYYIRFDTMKQFMQMKSDESIEGLLQLLSKSGEFADVRLRVVEKRLLNSLNGTNKDGQRIRFPIKEKIKSKEMKVNCLIQATLDGRQVYDNALSQEAKHILATASRLSRGLVLLVWSKGYFRSLLSALYLSKSLHCSMWENSTFVSRQLPGIGPALSTVLVMAGKTTFRSLMQANPRDLETILNRNPPFGNNLQKDVMTMPMYGLHISEIGEENAVEVKLSIINRETVEKFGDLDHRSALVVGAGGSPNILLHKEFIRDQALIIRGGEYSVKLSLEGLSDVNEIEAHMISRTIVGLDVVTKLKMSGSAPSVTEQRQQNVQTCIDKYMKKKKNIVREKSPKIRKVDKKEAQRQSNLSFNMDKFVRRAKSKKSITELATASLETENAQEMRTSPFSNNSSHGKSEHSWNRTEEGIGERENEEEEQNQKGNEEDQTRRGNLVNQLSGRSHRGLDSLTDTDSGYNSVQVRENSSNNCFVADICKESSEENFDSNFSAKDSNNNNRQLKPEMDVVEQICSKYKGPNSIFKWTKRIPRFAQPKVESVRSSIDQAEETYEKKLVQGICDEVSGRILAPPLGNRTTNTQSTRKAQSSCGSTKITDYLGKSLRSFTTAKSLIGAGAPKSTISKPVNAGGSGRMPSRSDTHQRTSYPNSFQSSRDEMNKPPENAFSVGSLKTQENSMESSNYMPCGAPENPMMKTYNKLSYQDYYNSATRNETQGMLRDDSVASTSRIPRDETKGMLWDDSVASTSRIPRDETQGMLWDDSVASTSRIPRDETQGMLWDDSVASTSRIPRDLSEGTQVKHSPITTTRMSRTEIDRRESGDYSNFTTLSDEIQMEGFAVTDTSMSRNQVNKRQSEDYSNLKASNAQDIEIVEEDSSVISSRTSNVTMIKIEMEKSSDDGFLVPNVESKNMSDLGLVTIKVEKDCKEIGVNETITSGKRFEERLESDPIKITTSTTHPAPSLDSEVSKRQVDDQATHIVENFELRNTKFYPIFSRRLDAMLESSKDLLPEIAYDEELNASTTTFGNQECEVVGVEERNVQFSQYNSKPSKDLATDFNKMSSNIDSTNDASDEMTSSNANQSIVTYSNHDGRNFSSTQDQDLEATIPDSTTFPQKCSQATSNFITRLESQASESPYGKTTQSPHAMTNEVSNNVSHYFQQSMDVSSIPHPNEQNLASANDYSFQQQFPDNSEKIVHVLHENTTTGMSIRSPEDLEVATYLHCDRATENRKDRDLSRFPDNSEFDTYPQHNRTIQRRTANNLSRFSRNSEVYPRNSYNTTMENTHFNNSHMKHIQNYEMTNLNDQNSTRYECIEPKKHYNAQDLLPKYAKNNKFDGVTSKIQSGKSKASSNFHEEYQTENQWYEEENDPQSLRNFSQESCFMIDRIMDDFDNGCLRLEWYMYENKPQNFYGDGRKVVNGADNKSRTAITQNYRTDDNYRYKSVPGHEFQQNNSKSNSPLSSHDNEEFATYDDLIGQKNCSQESTVVPMTDAQVLEQRGNAYTGNNKLSSQAHPESMKYTSNTSNYQLNNMESIEKCQRFLKNQQETMKNHKLDTKNKPASLNYQRDTVVGKEDELFIWDTNSSRYISYEEEQSGTEVYDGRKMRDSINSRIGSKYFNNMNYSSSKMIDHSNTANKHEIPIANFSASNVSQPYVETYDSVDLISPEEFSPPTMHTSDNNFEGDDGNLQGTNFSFCSGIKTDETDRKFETSALKLFENSDRKSQVEKFGCFEDCSSHSNVRSGCLMNPSMYECHGPMKKTSCMHCACAASVVSGARCGMPACAGRRDPSCACQPVGKPNCPCFATSHHHNHFAESPSCTHYPTSCHATNSGACANRCVSGCNEIIRKQPMGCCSSTRSYLEGSQCCLTSSQMSRCHCGDGGQSEGGFSRSVSGVRDFICAGELQARATPDLATTSSYPFSTRASTSATPASACGCFNCETLSQSLSQTNNPGPF